MCGWRFAVAAQLEPGILVIDEVLVVGDTQFQAKCLGKMDDGSRQQGRTVVFVSHNMHAVSTLTTRCLLLREGRAVLEGPPETVISGYMEEAGGERKSIRFTPIPALSEVSGLPFTSMANLAVLASKSHLHLQGTAPASRSPSVNQMAPAFPPEPRGSVDAVSISVNTRRPPGKDR